LGDADWMYVEEGKHAFKPKMFRYTNAKILQYKYKFNETVNYNLGNDNQCDWNKGGGLSAHLFTNHKNSAMWSWRYDLNGDILIAPYFHINGETLWAKAPCSTLSPSKTDNSLPYVRVKPNQEFTITFSIITKNRVGITINVGGKDVYVEKEFPKASFKWWREIGPWFGGNEVAPQKIYLYRLRLK